MRRGIGLTFTPISLLFLFLFYIPLFFFLPLSQLLILVLKTLLLQISELKQSSKTSRTDCFHKDFILTSLFIGYGNDKSKYPEYDNLGEYREQRCQIVVHCLMFAVFRPPKLLSSPKLMPAYMVIIQLLVFLGYNNGPETGIYAALTTIVCQP